MNIKAINEALLFYGITDENYKIKCYECLEYIKSKENLLNEFYALYKILFIDKSNKIRELWKIKSLDELFSEKTHPYITNLLLLSGYKVHNDNFKKLNLDVEQIVIHKSRVKDCLINDIIVRNYNGIRISQMLWGAYFINIRLIEVGILQYEKYKNHIKIHIPPCGKLNIYKVNESLNKSKYYIAKYFNMREYNYFCDSWLLSKQIHNIVNENCNIYKFYELFNIEDGESCIDDILNFVYQTIEIKNYEELQEKTNLQRIIKNYLLKGNDIKLGKGILKKE